MAARFEIVRANGRGHDQSQPWHARYVAANGQIVWVTETYTRRRGAENAILSIAHALGHLDPRLTWNVPEREQILIDAVDDERPWLSVITVDERQAA